MTDLDHELPGIAAGDPDAFARWVAGAEPVLRARLRPLAARLDVESLLQEVLLRVWTTAARCHPDGRPHALLRWALRIQHNLGIDELRKARVDATDADALERHLAAATSGDGDDGGAADPLLRKLLDDCLRRLPAKPKSALLARWSSEGAQPDAALAAQLAMQPNTFLQNVTRARKLLGDCLRGRGAELPGGAR